ncbi:major facilitator superfamily domain-containing protein [Glomus cerebriforme]|uniref:Major facilitator superfamily domain-containing protein n=1 Tax=Glomus cerebriforme TaxID=658196 RepID=A0A397TM05_9GLOM|nr:major facilitator superfamily domain-containing protein [Glomus cerebriforme]
MTASSSIATSVTEANNLTSRHNDSHDYERVGEKSGDLDIIVEKTSEIQNDSSIALISPSNTQSRTTAINNKNKSSSNRKWIVLASFSLLSFSNAVLWITFGPCLYIFMAHYNQTTPSYINALATVYMVVYPILLLPILKIFDKWGLRQGVLIGAFLNALGTFLRFMGSFGPSGFWLLFLGQTIAAIAGVFILGIPPKLANTWFEFGEQNFATGIGVTANNAGIAVGFLLSPWFIKEDTASNDIPTYLLIQFGACSLIYLICVTTFASEAKFTNNIYIFLFRSSNHTDKTSTTFSTMRAFCADKAFMLLATSYGLTVGASYAVSTLLAQIVVPVFKMHDENQVGFLGFLNVVAGMVGSVLIGVYLDRTFAYKRSCRILYIITLLSLGFFTIGLKTKNMLLVSISFMFFGVSTFAITPAVFQYAPVITSSRLGEDEITSTGILNSAAQIWGIVLVALMDTTENVDQEFTMELSCLLLLAISFIGMILIWLVKEDYDIKNGKEQEAQHLMK